MGRFFFPLQRKEEGTCDAIACLPRTRRHWNHDRITRVLERTIKKREERKLRGARRGKKERKDDAVQRVVPRLQPWMVRRLYRCEHGRGWFACWCARSRANMAVDVDPTPFLARTTPSTPLALTREAKLRLAVPESGGVGEYDGRKLQTAGARAFMEMARLGGKMGKKIGSVCT